MKIKMTLTILLTIFGLTLTPVLTSSQNKVATPNTPTNFSVFGLPQNIGTVNTGDNESGVSIAPNGLSLYVSSNTSGTLGSIDIWVSQRPTLTSAWGPLQNLGAPVNSLNNENLPSLSPDGKTMFFNCSCPDAIGGADIYMTTRTDPNNDFGWTAPVNLGPVINTVDNELGAGYFQDPVTGNAILYFTSNRSGSEDIFQSTRNPNGTFNAPTNVAALNSPSVDRGLSVRRDGLEIFFASERPAGGLGGRDIWVSTRASVSDPWNPPVNVAGVNSSGSDQMPSLSPDGSILYLASSRDGSSDLYAASRLSVNRGPKADFDGDGRTDLSVFRPSDGTWYVMESGSNTFRATQFGANGDGVVPGDYDGDGRTDFAVVRQSGVNLIWYVLRSSDSGFSAAQWGLNTDKPVPGDYDGDGRMDIAVYRDGTWFIIQSSNGGVSYQQFGLSSDIPIPASVQ